MALLNFTADSYVVGFWLFPVTAEQHPPNGGDVMARLYKNKITDQKWEALVRHRYKYDDEVRFGNSKDRLSAHRFTIGGDEDTARRKMNEAIMLITALAKVPTEELTDLYFDVRGDMHKMAALIEAGKAPRWMNMMSIKTTKPAP